MRQPWVCSGIDWATAHHDIAIVDDSGQVVARGRVGNDAAGLVALMALLAEAGGSAEHPIPVGIETDKGIVGGGVAGDRPGDYPINPLAASRYRARYAVSGAKSDATDAVLLANIIRTDPTAHRLLPARVLARAEQDAVRRASRTAIRSVRAGLESATFGYAVRVVEQTANTSR